MNQSLTTLVFLLTGCLFIPTPAYSLAEEKQPLYIGIEKNRSPYSNLDNQQQAYGILVDRVRYLCQAIKAECHFIADNFDKLMYGLQAYRLHALIIIDTVVLPEIDKLKLTSPLCRIQPVFIQNQSDKKKIKKKNFEQNTIGVLEGSLLHFYLLDEYSLHARLKPYPLLESGVFDLFFGKIDALFTSQAFFNDRVLKTALGREDSKPTLIALPENETKIPATSMTLALKARNTELYDALEKEIQTKDPQPNCARLLETKNPETAKSETDKPAPTD